LGLIPRGLPRFLEESLKTDGFHPIKNYLPLNASWACPEDYLLERPADLRKYLKEVMLQWKIKRPYPFILSAILFTTTVTLSNGVPLETVSKLLPHTKLSTTQIYARVLDNKLSKDMVS